MNEMRKQTSSVGPSSKRARYDDFANTSSTFEEELALLDTLETESELSQSSQSQESQDSVKSNLIKNNDFMSNRSKWRRPNSPYLNPSKDSLIFQQLDIDNYVGRFSTTLEFLTL